MLLSGSVVDTSCLCHHLLFERELGMLVVTSGVRIYPPRQADGNLRAGSFWPRQEAAGGWSWPHVGPTGDWAGRWSPAETSELQAVGVLGGAAAQLLLSSGCYPGTDSVCRVPASKRAAPQAAGTDNKSLAAEAWVAGGVVKGSRLTRSC